MKLTAHLESVLKNDFNMVEPRSFIDSRSPYFFHLQDQKLNYMFLLKKEFPDDLLEKILPHCRKEHAFLELPQISKESSEYALFSLPKGKLFRLTDEKITSELQNEVVRIQKKLNALLENTPYSWGWELPYFFKTTQGLMYIDLESIQENVSPFLLTPPIYEEMNFKEKVLMKINRLKNNSSS